MRKCINLIILGLLVLTACNSSELQDARLLGIGSSNTLIQKAENLRNCGNYRAAQLLFDSLSQGLNLTHEEIKYSVANAHLCKIMANDTLYTADTLLLEEPFNSIIKGVLKIRNGNSGISEFHNAIHYLGRHKKEDTFEYFLTLELIGRNYRLVDGEMDSALHYFKLALDFSKRYKILISHTPVILHEISDVCIINRDAVTGMGYINEALRNPIDSLLRVKCLIVKGTLFRKMNRYDSARFLYGEADEIISKYKYFSIAPSLLTEQMLLSTFEKNDSTFFRQLRRLQSINRKYDYPLANENRLLGYYYYERGETNKSVHFYESVVKEFERMKVPDLVVFMESLYALIEQYTALKQYDMAERYVYKSLVFTTSLKNSPYTWTNVKHELVVNELYNFVNYNLLAKILVAKAANRDKSVFHFKRALEIYSLIDSTMQKQIRVVEEDALLTFLSISREIYDGAIETCFNLHELTRDSSYLSCSHQFMERSKGLIIYRDILTRSETYFPNVPKEFRNRELMYKAKISALKKNTSYYSGEMMNIIKQMDAYYTDMESRYPQYYAAKYEISIPTFKHFQEVSKERKIDIVQYHWTGSYVYSLTYGEDPILTRIPNDSVFINALTNLKHDIRQQPDLTLKRIERDFMKSSSFLYSKLIRPLNRVSKKLLIIPDGDLNFIPFEIFVPDTLHNFRKAQFFLKDCIVNYSQSLKAYELGMNDNSRKINTILTYDDGNTKSRLPSLSGASREVRSMQEVFKDKRIISRTGREINRRQLLLDLESEVDLIHIALHASSSTVDRLDSKILFSDRDVTTPVYGFEIAPLDIKASTIVLNGCESAIGRQMAGEGAYSLARAFRQAGAKTVISSLWNLSDYSTSEITGNFYHYIQAGHTASESLTIAKRDYLLTADELTAHPFFWSAMICQGY